MKDLLLLALVILGGALLLRLARRVLTPAQTHLEAQALSLIHIFSLARVMAT